MDDINLIESYKSWDNSSLSIIYEKYVEKIYNFIYFKTYNTGVSQDLTSDTFLKLIKSLKKFDTKKENTNLKSYIYKIAYNNVIDYYKKQKEDICLDEILEIWVDDNIWDNIDNKSKLKEVLEYINTLNNEHKEILIMRIWDNMSYKEISKITWKTEDNCKKIVSRTLLKINSNITLLLLILLNNNIF